VLLFSATLFLSAFLLFTVELIVAKTVLPTLGGVPMVWNTCMVFFQITLLGGYMYAHGATTWLGARRHALVYAVLLGLPLFFLPFSTIVSDARPPEGNPIGWLIVLLLGWVGLPFFVLSTSAAVLQHWFSTTDDSKARDPYFLYAASNLGSLLALVAYPSIVEPALRLSDQSRVWAVGYATFVVAAWVCAVVVWRRGTSGLKRRPDRLVTSDERGPRTTPISGARRARWVALSFVPSSLMLAVTSYLSTDIATVPLLWVIPLSLYLLTFVVAFGSRSQRATAVADRVLPLLILPLVVLMIAPPSAALWLVGFHLAAFTAASLLCHGQIANDRPSPSYLTEFYFWIALGGMLGGLFNTLAAPMLFTSVVEYPLVLVMACLLRVGTPAAGDARRVMDVVVPLAVGVLTFGLIIGLSSASGNPRLVFASLALPAFASFSQSRRHPARFALSLGAMLLAGTWASGDRGRTLHTERTFFGVYRVAFDASGRYRALYNGTTLHGMQPVDPARRHESISYYYPGGPFSEAATRLPNVARATDVAVVGLGVGSLASFVTPGQRWTFFEIDPAVERLARSTDYFTYLSDCGDPCRVVLGDARISLARDKTRYGLIVLDAFSSDAIPIHLLTSEALAVYLSRLAPGGVMALHISNRHLSLAPVLARLAERHGLSAIERRDGTVSELESSNGKTPSNWMLMARSAADLGPLVSDPKWVVPVASGSTPLWTDDSSSILSALRLRRAMTPLSGDPPP
jgi:hypothetical protein